jgi:hypothetical protein
MKHEITEKEIWVNVLGYESFYEVSNLGNVKTLGNNKFGISRIMKNTLRKGYCTVTLRKKNIQKIFRVHRLVAEAFIPNPNKKPQVNHINGVKNDNRVVNLEWTTASENMTHASNNNLLSIIKGEKHHNFKLSEEKIKEIIFLSDKFTQKQLSIKFNVSQALINLKLSIVNKNKKVILDKESNVFYESVNEVCNLYKIKSYDLRRKLRGERFNNTNFIYV